jgi:L-ribulose-5-phosphate 3-epimerase
MERTTGISRRALLAAGAGAILLAKKPAGLKIGVMDTVLKLRSKPEAIALANKLGLEGMQVTLGRPESSDHLPLADPELQAKYVAESRRHNLPLDATYLDILHVNCLKNDALARKWVLQGIEITRKLNVRILMTVFFGKCSVLNRQELEYVASAFKELAPEAGKAGVILGFENLLNAEDNARALDIVASKAFKVYYDVGNSTNRVGVDAAKEIRWLGKDRICQFHFKDEKYLGEGKVDFPAILQAIADIDFQGYANLETSSPSGSVENDIRRNFTYLRKLMRA